jgi:hypothetical protein
MIAEKPAMPVFCISDLVAGICDDEDISIGNAYRPSKKHHNHA